ncbi:MAG: hypothetical protein LBR75_07000 [Prevotellaceae bacterium]|jgi:hypothetical protein|nr:hypothetical protein [Prevotellaceae bacterium]
MENFDKIWNTNIKSLENKKVYTLSENKENEILEVNDRFLKRRSSNGEVSEILKSDFYWIYDLLQERGSITRQEIQDCVGWCSSIVATVLAQLPNIQVSCSPVITLTFKKHL